MRWISILVLTALPAHADAQGAPTLATEKDKLSYAMGMDLGGQLKARSVDIDPSVFERGLKAALAEIGFGNGLTSEPLAPATDEQRRRIAGVMRELAF